MNAEFSVSAAIAARATLLAWVVEAYFEVAARSAPQHLLTIVESPAYTPPEVEPLIEPLGAVRVLRADVFPALQFDEMSAPARRHYTRHYAHYLRWQHARARGVDVAELVAWRGGYDPLLLDERLQRWLTPGS